LHPNLLARDQELFFNRWWRWRLYWGVTTAAAKMETLAVRAAMVAVEVAVVVLTMILLIPMQAIEAMSMAIKLRRFLQLRLWMKMNHVRS
jgi:hypothetical protein